MIRLAAVSDVEISIDSKLGQENAMQANIVASTSLQNPNKKNKNYYKKKGKNNPKASLTQRVQEKRLKILTIK